MVAPSAQAAQIVDLGSFTPTAVNSSDVVIGSDTASGVWQNGVVTHLQAPGTGGVGGLEDINDAGQIVGEIFNQGPVNGYCSEATRWDLPAVDAPHPLGFLDPTGGQCHNGYSQAYGINRFGDVAGESRVGQPGTYRAAIFRIGAANPVEVGAADAPAGGGYSYGRGITDDGKVLGGWYSNSSSSFRNLLWPGPASPGTPINLAYHTDQGGNHLVSGDGVVVGGSGTTAYQRGLDGSLTAMGTFIPAAVNLSHDVVGNDYSAPDSEVPVEWKNGGLIHLSSLVPPGSGWQLIQATDIADNGDIVGQGKLNGELHGFLLKAPSLDVTLDAYDEQGNQLTGSIAPSQDVRVVETITNNTGFNLHDLSFARDEALGAEQGSGGLQIVSGPDPAFDSTQTLAKGASLTYSFNVATIADGISAVDTKLTALDDHNVPVTGAHSLRFDIVDANTVDSATGEYVVLQAIDDMIVKNFRGLYDGLVKRGKDLHKELSKYLSPSERKRWFGDKHKLVISLVDRARALQNGSAPEMMAAQFPKRPIAGYSAEVLNDAYNHTFKEVLGEGVSDWAKDWSDLGHSAKKALERSWAESVLTFRWTMGTATPEERAQLGAQLDAFVRGSAENTTNLINTLRTEIPRWKDNLFYFEQAMVDADNQLVGIFPKLIAKQAQARAEILKLADDKPLEFQRESAKADAELMSKGLTLIADTLIGGGAAKVAAAGKSIVVAGKGAAVINAGEALGVLDETGAVAKGSSSAIELANTDLPHGIPAGTAAEIEAEGGFLEDLDAATVVRSADVGRAYEVANLGGVPETTLDAKAGILSQLEDAYRKATGKELKLAEILKPSSALRKEGGVAKLELTGQKTGKPAMIDAGMPDGALGEASVWRSKTNPKDLPGFDDWPAPRQESALNEWKKANEAWAEFEHPEPGSKSARLKEAIGQPARVPLDLQPNEAGLQRFVNAEFEVVHVVDGDAEAKLIRVKKYQIEVVDTNSGRVVNTRTVVDSPKALPQTPDADAVAVAKVVGTDANGQPILAQLDRSEREFVMQRYIDKNIKARRAGLIPDLAEHSTTLIMDDAGAKAAGYLIPKYGAPFLPEAVGRAYLTRIAPYVKPAELTAEQMVETMLQLVQSEGGFGQHAVVVTSDSRFLGEVPFGSW
jgi:hypothetical protein